MVVVFIFCFNNRPLFLALIHLLINIRNGSFDFNVLKTILKVKKIESNRVIPPFYGRLYP